MSILTAQPVSVHRRLPARSTVQIRETQHSSALLSLPVELRLAIYEYLFGVPAFLVNDHRVLLVREASPNAMLGACARKDGPMSLENGQSTCSVRFSSPQKHLPALLRTCSRIYFESMATFWAAVLVQFDPSFLGIPPFLGQTSNFSRLSITSIALSRYIYGPGDPRYAGADKAWALTCSQLAVGLPNLREVRVALSGDIGQLAEEGVRNEILRPVINVGWESVIVLKIRFEGLFAEAEAVESLVSIGGLAWIEGSDVVLWRYISFKGLQDRDLRVRHLC
jgi:hypothetical protein